MGRQISHLERTVFYFALVFLLLAACVPIATPTPGFATPTPEDADDWTPEPTLAPQRGVVVSPDGLNVRSGPGTTYAIVHVLHDGAIVYIIGNNEAGDWLQLTDGGWVYAAYVRLEIT